MGRSGDVKRGYKTRGGRTSPRRPGPSVALVPTNGGGRAHKALEEGEASCVHNHALWQRGSFTNAAVKDSRFDLEGACSHDTVHSRLGLHRSEPQLLNAGSLELGTEGLQYRLNVAQEENRVCHLA